MESKVERQRELIELLENRVFRSQGQVVQAMQERGFNVTQPSISRDFRELGVVKMSGRYLPVDRPGARMLHDKLDVNPLSLITSVSTAGPHLLVVMTHVGAASVVGLAIDSLELHEIVGTIAGDDTVFIAATGEGGQERVLQMLHEIALRNEQQL